MIFLLLAKLMNKVLLTSLLLNSYCLRLVPGHLERLITVLGILFLITLTASRTGKNGFIFNFSNNQCNSVKGICEDRCCQHIYCVMNMLYKEQNAQQNRS